MMFSLKAQELFVESVSPDLRSVYFYPISMQKNVRFCVYIGKYEKVMPIYVVFLQKRIRCTYMKMCASDSLDGVWCVVISSEQAHK